jgi:hypothetical protein
MATSTFKATVEGTPKEVELETTMVMIRAGAYPLREVLGGDVLQLPGGHKVDYDVYSMGPPDEPGPERIANVPGSNTFYYSPYHYKPGPGVPNAWVQIDLFPSK